MNLDLLKKLTRLANNNPNDNEANLAARRVCKMLEESDWKILPEVKTAYGKMNEGQWASPKPPDPNSDWFNRQQHTQPRRPDNPNQEYDSSGRPKPPNPPKSPPKKESVKPPSGWRNPFDGLRDEFFDEIFNRSRSRKNQEGMPRPLKCTKCEKMQLTTFIGNPAVFICQDCNWSK